MRRKELNGWRKVPSKAMVVGVWISIFVVALAILILPASADEEWSPDIRLTFDGSQGDPDHVVDSQGNIHVVYQDHREGDEQIYYKKLNKYGVTVVDDKLLISAQRNREPELCLDSQNNVHIVWQCQEKAGLGYDEEIYYAKLDNNGKILVRPKRLTPNDDRDSVVPDLAVDSMGNVHIVWEDYRDHPRHAQIYYTKLDNNGKTLVDDLKITSSDEGAENPSIAVDSANNVHIVWQDCRTTLDWDIYYTKLDNNGNTLIDDKRLTYSERSVRPDLTIDSGNYLHMTWNECFEENENYYWSVYYAKLDEYGNHLTGITPVTNPPSYSYDPAISVDSNRAVHITWREREGDGHGLYYTKLWAPIQRLSDNSSVKSYPKIAIDSNDNVHLTWADCRHGSSSIYYKTNAPMNYPTVSIYTDKTNYTTGDMMHVGINVTNPGDAMPVRFAVWLEQPSGRIYVLTYTSVTLPTGLDYSNPDFAVFTLPGLPSGTYTWDAALIEASGSVVFISHDTVEWEFVSAVAGAAPAEDIAGVLEQTTVDIRVAGSFIVRGREVVT